MSKIDFDGSMAIAKKDPLVILKDTHGRLLQAEALRAKRSFKAAEKLCLKLLREFPDYFAALHTLGLIYGDMNERQKAISYLVQASMVNPSSWTTLTALAGEFILAGAKESAARALRDALEIKSDEPTIYATLTRLHLDRRQYLQAYETSKRALELDPNFEPCVFMFAQACIELGRQEEAEPMLRKNLASEHPSLESLRLMLHFPPDHLSEDLLDDLERVKHTPNSDKPIEKNLDCFVRAVAYDKLGKHEQAWEWATKANQLVFRQIRDRVVDEIRTTEGRLDWIKKNHAKLLKSNCAPDEQYPQTLFIFGASRSGKTTAESIIASQKGVKRGYENSAIDQAVKYAFQTGGFVSFPSIGQLPTKMYPTVGEKYRELIDMNSVEHKIFTSTSPGHIWESPFFSQSIPNIRFLFIKRNIDDLMLRIYMKNYKSGNNYSYEISALRKYIMLYEEMIDSVSALFPENSIIMQYEEMVSNPTRALESICAFCDLELDTSLLPEVGNDVGCSKPYAEYIKSALSDSDTLF